MHNVAFGSVCPEFPEAESISVDRVVLINPFHLLYLARNPGLVGNPYILGANIRGLFAGAI